MFKVFPGVHKDDGYLCEGVIAHLRQRHPHQAGIHWRLDLSLTAPSIMKWLSWCAQDGHVSLSSCLSKSQTVMPLKTQQTNQHNTVVRWYCSNLLYQTVWGIVNRKNSHIDSFFVKCLLFHMDCCSTVKIDTFLGISAFSSLLTFKMGLSLPWSRMFCRHMRRGPPGGAETPAPLVVWIASQSITY